MIVTKPRSLTLERGALPPGLVGAWLFSEGGGNVTRELASRGLSSLNGPTWGALQVGRGLTFTNNTYVDTNEATRYNFPASSFTLMVRARLSSPASHHGFLSNLNFGANTGWLWRSEGGSSDHRLVIGNSLFSVPAGVSLNNNVWHTYSLVVNQGVNIVAYLNAAQTGVTAVTKTVSSSGLNLYIGKEQGVSYGLVGNLAHVFIFDRALSHSQIARIYADPYRAFRPRLAQPLLSSGASGSTAQLSWTDNSGGGQTFSVERSDVSAYAGFAEVASEIGTTTYNDEELAGGTYWYRVRGFDGSVYSDYTNVVQITVS